MDFGTNCVFIFIVLNLSPSLSYADSVPADLKEPFYTDQYEQEHLKPAVVSLLLSAELYCRAGSLILTSGGHHAVTQPLVGHHAVIQPLVDHDAVIQALAQKGLHVTDQTRLVTERDLCKRPLQMVRDSGWVGG